jgi:acetate kinase
LASITINVTVSSCGAWLAYRSADDLSLWRFNRSAPCHSRVRVFLIRNNEELMIARHTHELLMQSGGAVHRAA